MRISFSGAACTGKTTTFNAFLNKWNNYKTLQPDYRHLIKGKKHSKFTDKRTQKSILEFMYNSQKNFTLHDNIVYDRSPIDNLVYTLWAYEKNIKGFNEKFVNDCMGIVRESMRSLDIIFLCTRDLMGSIVSDGKREVDPVYVAETDNIFKAISKQSQSGTSPLFPPNDSPAIIEIYGTTKERIAQVALYVTEEGTMYGEEQSIVNFDELIKMKSLIEEQRGQITKENKLPIINPNK
jgi:hypothetical protein